MQAQQQVASLGSWKRYRESCSDTPDHWKGSAMNAFIGESVRVKCSVAKVEAESFEDPFVSDYSWNDSFAKQEHSYPCEGYRYYEQESSERGQIDCLRFRSEGQCDGMLSTIHMTQAEYSRYREIGDSNQTKYDRRVYQGHIDEDLHFRSTKINRAAVGPPCDDSNHLLYPDLSRTTTRKGTVQDRAQASPARAARYDGSPVRSDARESRIRLVDRDAKAPALWRCAAGKQAGGQPPRRADPDRSDYDRTAGRPRPKLVAEPPAGASPRPTSGGGGGASASGDQAALRAAFRSLVIENRSAARSWIEERQRLASPDGGIGVARRGDSSLSLRALARASSSTT